MKVYIMTDQEGVAGVVNWEDYGSPGARLYELACRLLTLEVNAAIEGFLAAGATDFLVADGHGHGSIDQCLLHPKARLFCGRPVPGPYPFAIDDSFAAACQIGQHAKANTDGGHLSHTGSFSVDDLVLNGRSLGEMGINMTVAGYYGVPSILVAGDQAATEEARDLVPNIETVAVKEGVKRGQATGLAITESRTFNCCATHLSPETARERIAAAAERALNRLDEIKPFFIPPPYQWRQVLRPEQPCGPFRVGSATGDDLIALLNGPKQYAWSTGEPA